MISPAPNGIPEFVRPLTVGLAISVGYVAAHFVLSLLSTKLEIAHNISVWYLPGGLLFGCLMAARGSQVWWVLIGDVAARTLWAVGVAVKHSQHNQR